MLKSKNLIWIIITLGLALRLINIFNPLIGDNSWRQTDTAAMARNYYENGFNFSYPQIDWGGESEGYVETEFPVYPFIVSLLYKLFGVHDFLGRILSVIFSLITIWAVFKIVTRIINERVAVWTCFFLAILPYNVFYNRNFFPEPMLIMSIALGLHFFIRWIDSETWEDFSLSAIFISLACLLKIPTLYIGLPLLFIAYQKYTIGILKQWRLFLFSFIVFLSVALWYYHAHSIYLQSGLTFGIWEYGSDKWGNWNLVATWSFWNSVFFRNLAEKHFTWFGFIILIVGLFVKRKSKMEFLFDFWLIALLVYVVIVAKGNAVHAYYQLPFVIPGSVFMAKVFEKYFHENFPNRKNKIVLSVALVGIIGFTAWRFFYLLDRENINKFPDYELGLMIDKTVPMDKRILVVDRNDPTILYLSHRKGWHAWPSDVNQVVNEKNTKVEYIAGVLGYFDEGQRNQLKSISACNTVIWENDKSFILKINQ